MKNRKHRFIETPRSQQCTPTSNHYPFVWWACIITVRTRQCTMCPEGEIVVPLTILQSIFNILNKLKKENTENRILVCERETVSDHEVEASSGWSSYHINISSGLFYISSFCFRFVYVSSVLTTTIRLNTSLLSA